MGTHDENNNAEPQNEFLSGFKIKDRAESQQDFTSQTGKDDGGYAFNQNSSGPHKNADSNVYRFTQQTDKNSFGSNAKNGLFDEKSGTGIIKKIQGKLFKGNSEPGDKKQKIMTAMIPVLLVVMVFMFRQVLSKPPQKAKGVESENESTLVKSDSSNNEINWKIPEPLPIKINKSLNTGNNTTSDSPQENAANNTEDKTMYINSIVYSTDKPSVIIGNKILYLNQEINGVIVVDIQKDYVVLEKDGERWMQKVAEVVRQEKIDQDNK